VTAVPSGLILTTLIIIIIIIIIKLYIKAQNGSPETRNTYNMCLNAQFMNTLLKAAHFLKSFFLHVQASFILSRFTLLQKGERVVTQFHTRTATSLLSSFKTSNVCDSVTS
jgi:hypothetical protein